MSPPKRSIHNHRPWWDVVQPALDSCSIIASLAAVGYAEKRTLDDSMLLMGLVSTIVFLIVGRYAGLHRQSHIDNVDDEISSIVWTWFLTILVLSLLAFATRSSELYSRAVMLAWILLTPALIGVCRMAIRIVQHGLHRRGIGVRRVAIAGLNDLGRQTEMILNGDTGLGWQVVGFYDDRPVDVSDDATDGDELIGNWGQMVADARSGKIDTVLITLPMRAEERIRVVLDQLSDSTASVYVIPDFFVFELLHSSWKSVGGLPAVSIFENPLSGIDGLSKRITDVVLAGFGLLVVSIPMLVIALAIKWTSPGPVFFRQRRYGLDGREILVWKFRSMRTCDNGAVVKQATRDDPRITPLGSILRKTSLDELPQLFNVLEGSMSLVGPRPHASAHNEQYRTLIRGYMLRHKVKPGITGLAQVNGCRGETDTIDKMQRRVELDHEYIRGWSLWLDLRILLRTLAIAWRQPEAY
ncbi:MAG: undecaprenyl-phosphate glucose phosphotransferase [Planctomycetaceae bacterium]